MAEARTWMPFYIGDYLADTMHLTTEQHGAYLLLIIAYWRNRGPISADNIKLRATARMDAKAWAESRETLAAFFQIDGNTWRHKRIDAELAKATAIAEAKAKAGAKGGQKRWHKDSTAIADAWQRVEQTDTPSPSPSPTSLRSVSPAPTERAPKARQGTRLSEGWVPLPSDLSYAEGRGFAAPQIADIAENFRTYWTAGGGRNKTHADWGKAWQAWIRKEKPHVASPGRKAAVLDPDEQVRRRRAQIAGGVAALRSRGRHDPGGEGGEVAGGEAGAGHARPEDHARADGGGARPHGGLGGHVQPPPEGLGQGPGFLHGGAETPAGRPTVDGDGTGAGEPQDGDAPAAAAGNRGPSRAGDHAPPRTENQAVPGPAVSGGRSGDDTVPGHDTRAAGGRGQDDRGVEGEVCLVKELPDFLRRESADIATRYEQLAARKTA